MAVVSSKVWVLYDEVGTLARGLHDLESRHSATIAVPVILLLNDQDYPVRFTARAELLLNPRGLPTWRLLQTMRR